MFRQTLMEEIYLAMRETIAIPEHDRFATITELHPENINNSGNYAGIDRTDGIVFVQITLNSGRTVEQKQALFSPLPAACTSRLRSARKMCLSASSRSPSTTGRSATVSPNTRRHPGRPTGGQAIEGLISDCRRSTKSSSACRRDSSRAGASAALSNALAFSTDRVVMSREPAISQFSKAS